MSLLEMEERGRCDTRVGIRSGNKCKWKK